jgi:hypothetical protein
LLQVLCLPTAPVLPIGKTETSAGLDFMGSFSDKNCLPFIPYGYANFEHNRVAFDLALYLATLCGSLLIFSATEGTKCDGRWLYRRSRDEFWSRRSESPSSSPPAPRWGFSFRLGLLPSHWVQVIMFKMKTPNTPEKYTVKHIDEITDRIIALRVRWLRHVETQLASQQSRPVLDHYKLSTEPAE